MTASEMERRLLELGEEYIRTRDPEIRAEYARLHARWKAAK